MVTGGLEARKVGSSHYQLRPGFVGHLLEGVPVDHFGLLRDPVLHHVIEHSGEVDRVTMGEVPAV